MEHFFVELKELYPFLGEEGRAPKLEVFLRCNLGEKRQSSPVRPTILLLPGGGYRAVVLPEAEPVALPFIAAGYNVCILTYSVAPHHDPAQIIEVAASSDAIRKNAEAWHADTDRLAIMGFSAGAHLAAYYSNRYDCEAVRRHFPDSKNFRACVLGYPLITSDDAYTHIVCMERLIGHENSTPEERAAFSCEKMVTKNTPPTFIWSTRTDHIVPIMNSLIYAGALAKNDVPFSLHIYPFGRHGLVTADLQTNLPEKLENGAGLAASWVGEAVRWLNVTLGL